MIILELILVLLAFAGLNYFLLVPLGGFWCTYFFYGMLLLIIIIMLIWHKHKKRDEIISKSSPLIFLFLIIPLFILLINSPLFRANSYKNLLKTPKELEFNKEVEPFDITKAPIVTETTAEQIADKSISQDGTLGSRAKLGALTLQKVKDDLYWVAPLEHSGFFPWLNNKDEGTPYIMVNANTKEVKLVKCHIKYQPKAFFGQDLGRKLFMKDMTKGYTDFTFEVDDNGKPFYTATIYKNKVGFRGPEATGTAVVNAETGEVKLYSVSDTPSWVDRIQPLKFVENDINWYGKYIHGFSPFNDNNKIKATKGTGIVYNEGKCYYYTGITSVGKDESTLGFYLIDTRTLETKYFKMSGATETSAMKSAEGKVQNLGYKGTFPLLMNVENTPTYFVPLQDKNDLTKLYAMVNVEDYTIIATGETVNECKETYVKALFTKNKLSNVKGESKEIKGTIKRIGSYVIGGSTFYVINLNESQILFTVAAEQSTTLPISKEGDTVTIKYVDSGNKNITSSSFNNNTINP